MVRLIGIFLAIALLAAGAAWFADNPGAVAVDWRGYRLETSLSILLLAFGLVLVTVLAIFGAIRRIRSGISHLSARRAMARQRRGLQTLTQGMVALAAGDAAAASREAARADELLGKAPLTLLMRAQAAQLDGDDEAVRVHYEAMLGDPEMEFVGLRGLINRAVRNRDFAGARTLIDRAGKLRPKSPWVNTAKFEIACATGEWADARSALDAAGKAKLIGKSEAQRQRAVLAFARAQDALKSGWRSDALDHAQAALKDAPGLIPAAAMAARLMSETGKQRRAERILEKAWSLQPHPELAAAFCDVVKDEDPHARLSRFAKLRAANPDHRETALTGAELALAAGEITQARSFMGAVGEGGRSVRACMTMAMIAQAAGEADEARIWLGRAPLAAREPAWVCGTCGRRAAEWQLLCPACGAFDAQQWLAQDEPAGQPMLTMGEAIEATAETEPVAPGEADEPASDGAEPDEPGIVILEPPKSADDPGPPEDARKVAGNITA